MSNQWSETKKIYREFIHYQGYLDYEHWLSIPEDFKAAYLFVEFYNQIYLAWYKTDNGTATEEDGIEAVNSILIKNTKIISKDSNRYDEGYIFKICYNRLMNLCSKNSRPNAQRRKKLEISNYIMIHSKEINLFDEIEDDFHLEDYICNTETQSDIQNVLYNLDEDVYAVANHLMDGKKLRSFRGLSKERKDDIFEILKVNLYEFKDCYFA